MDRLERALAARPPDGAERERLADRLQALIRALAPAPGAAAADARSAAERIATATPAELLALVQAEFGAGTRTDRPTPSEA